MLMSRDKLFYPPNEKGICKLQIRENLLWNYSVPRRRISMFVDKTCLGDGFFSSCFAQPSSHTNLPQAPRFYPFSWKRGIETGKGAQPSSFLCVQFRDLKLVTTEVNCYRTNTIWPLRSQKRDLLLSCSCLGLRYNVLYQNIPSTLVKFSWQVHGNIVSKREKK